ncbi:MAG: galactokinase [Streptosporangiales bacterium]|nr:galactokinase [Streptosporangiales bacterium]
MTLPEKTSAGDVAAAFEERFGFPPAGVWAAPGRVNLLGEHTDYVGGFVLPVALPQQTYAAVGLRYDGILSCASTLTDERVELPVSELAPGSVRNWAAYPAGVVWALRSARHDVGGADVLIGGDVPLGAGLSSSAALECALGLALDELHGLHLGRAELALMCQHAENAFVGMPSGVMDQMASLCCQENYALYLDCRSLKGELIPFALAEHDLELLVIDTRVAHKLVSGAYADRRMSVEEAAMALGVRSLRDVTTGELGSALDKVDERLRPRTRHVVTENARVGIAVDLMRGGYYAALGQLMTMSHASLRDDYEVSCPELDTAVDTAMQAGALGARMTGGGFGGCAIALVPSAQRTSVEQAVTAAFAEQGFRAPHVFSVTASAGAQRAQ